ncbi:hypothetical protein RLW55_09125 [Hyphomicrobium sp. B1]|uniref:hypothetical protein n=1 Tax=unclassified Hyphomicrobium TaxID=2619925 RepID=UPI0039C0B8B6
MREALAIMLAFKSQSSNATGRRAHNSSNRRAGAFPVLIREKFLVRRDDKNRASLRPLPHLKIVLNRKLIALTELASLTNFTLATTGQSGYTRLGNFNLNAMETLA